MKRFNGSAFLFSVLCIGALSGCDLLESIKEYFIKPKKPAVIQSKEVSKTTNKEKSASQTQSPTLGANELSRIGNWSLTVEDFNQRLAALKQVVPEFNINDVESKKQVLEELIRQQLLVNEAERSGIAGQKDVVDAVEEFRRTLLVQEMARKITENVDVSEDELKAFYEQKKDILVEPTQWHVSEIVVDDKVKANELLVQLLKGADFAQTAKDFSIGDTAKNGGDLGFLKEEPFPAMVNALLPLKEADISSVFSGPKGFYIVKVNEKKGGKPLTFDAVKDDIKKNQVLLKQQQIILDYIEKLKSKADIEMNEALLN